MQKISASRIVLAGLIVAVSFRCAQSLRRRALTAAQLEQCVVQAKALDGTGSSLDITADRLDRTSKEISVAQDELEAKRASLKRTDPKQVAAFNQGIRSYNERVESQRTAVAAYKTAENSFNETVGTYNAACAKKYYVDDMNRSGKRSECNSRPGLVCLTTSCGW